MNTTGFEPMLRNAMVRAIDGISKKLEKSERAAGGAIERLLTRWNEMDRTEKENIAAVVITTATTAVGAIVAMKSRAKTAKKTVRKSGAGTAVKTARKLV